MSMSKWLMLAQTVLRCTPSLPTPTLDKLSPNTRTATRQKTSNWSFRIHQQSTTKWHLTKSQTRSYPSLALGMSSLIKRTGFPRLSLSLAAFDASPSRLMFSIISLMIKLEPKEKRSCLVLNLKLIFDSINSSTNPILNKLSNLNTSDRGIF